MHKIKNKYTCLNINIHVYQGCIASRYKLSVTQALEGEVEVYPPSSLAEVGQQKREYINNKYEVIKRKKEDIFDQD